MSSRNTSSSSWTTEVLERLWKTSGTTKIWRLQKVKRNMLSIWWSQLYDGYLFLKEFIVVKMGKAEVMVSKQVYLGEKTLGIN